MIFSLKYRFILFAVILPIFSFAQKSDKLCYEQLPKYSPENYICYRVSKPITIDGLVGEDEWGDIPYTNYFVDIMGDKHPNPHLKTRAKMCWDDKFFYIAAELEEPHLWATFTERESVMYHDNNFEFFIDPSATTHNYLELEMNAYGTEWDLLLTSPYRDKGIYLDSWNFNGMKSAVKCYGTLNNSKDIDQSWSVEIAIPWGSIIEVRRGRKMFKVGECMKVNYSRVQWSLEADGSSYKKCNNPSTGKISEYNWVWSAQGAVDLHRPELWGLVMISDIIAGQSVDKFIDDESDTTRWKLRCLYYRQREYKNHFKRYSRSIAELKPQDAFTKEEIKRLSIEASDTIYRINYIDENGKSWYILDNGYVDYNRQQIVL